MALSEEQIEPISGNNRSPDDSDNIIPEEEIC